MNNIAQQINQLNKDINNSRVNPGQDRTCPGSRVKKEYSEDADECDGGIAKASGVPEGNCEVAPGGTGQDRSRPGNEDRSKTELDTAAAAGATRRSKDEDEDQAAVDIVAFEQRTKVANLHGEMIDFVETAEINTRMTEA